MLPFYQRSGLLWMISTLTSTLPPTTLEIDDVVMKTLEGMVNMHGAAAIKGAMQALEKLPKEDHTVQLFESQHAKYNLGNFQIRVTYRKNYGNIILPLGAFHSMADHPVTRFLWYTWATTNISLSVSSLQMIFNEYVYGIKRDAITKWLGSRAQTFISKN